MILPNICIDGNVPLDEDEDGQDVNNDGDVQVDDIPDGDEVDNNEGPLHQDGWEVTRNLIMQRFAW